MNADGTKTSKSELSSLPITSSHKALAKRIFGKKMRSVIKQASAAGIDAIVNQQFEFAGKTNGSGLIIWLARSPAGAEGALQPQRGDDLRLPARAAVGTAAMDASAQREELDIGLRLGHMGEEMGMRPNDLRAGWRRA